MSSILGGIARTGRVVAIARTGLNSSLTSTPTVSSTALASSARLFSTTRTAQHLSNRPSLLSQRPRVSSTFGSSSSLVSRSIPPHARGKWSFARNGLLTEDFCRKHPYLASIFRVVLATVFGLTVLTGGIFLHDVYTYSQRKIEKCEDIDPLSLAPRRGGPKNLPIIEAMLDDKEDAKMRSIQQKPRLVILGGGWGAISVLKNLDKNEYNVTVVAPDNYFCFTPLLPSACVGTVEPRTLVEPLRRLMHRIRGHFIYGKAVDVAMSERLVEIEIPNPGGEGTTNAYVPYDKLIVAVGSRSNDHGVQGLENCFQLKTIPDAMAIRRRVMANLETASLPTTTPEERKRLLSFVVCGGGPTGVEIAAELSDMLEEDVVDFYPRILQKDISVSIIQSRDHILNTYSEKISEFAEKRFSRSQVKVHTNARVKEVQPGMVVVTVKDADGKTEVREIPSGLTVWSTGIAMQPFTKAMVERLPNQYHSKAVQVDNYLRVEGAPKGTIYAIGDASTIHLNMLNDLLALWDKFDENKDGKLDYSEWKKMARYLRKKYTLASPALEKIREVFVQQDTDHDESLSLNEVADLFIKLHHSTTALPPTAQVASQQGVYLAKKLNKLSKEIQTLRDNDIPDLDDEAFYTPFNYRHLGSLAYVGNSAVFDYYGFSAVGGLTAMYAWRSVYWSEQASIRSRFMLMLDWVKRGLFGRDLSKLGGAPRDESVDQKT